MHVGHPGASFQLLVAIIVLELSSKVKAGEKDLGKKHQTVKAWEGYCSIRRGLKEARP